MSIRIDIRTGYEGHILPTNSLKVVQKKDENLDDLIERVIQQLYATLEKYEGAIQNE